MARVLVAHEDRSLRRALARMLELDGHAVTEVGDGLLAASALCVARAPLVALLGKRLRPVAVADLLWLVAVPDSPLADHRYVVLTTAEGARIDADLAMAARAAEARLVSLPSGMESVPGLVAEAAAELLQRTDWRSTDWLRRLDWFAQEWERRRDGQGG